VGSATQISLFLIPFCIIIAWILGKPLSFFFQPYETATLALAVLLCQFLTFDGKSTWLSGTILIGAYLLVAAGFYAHKDES